VGEIKVKNLPAHRRPRERLLTYGPDHLSDAQLLAILLGSGTTKLNAISLAQKILKRYPLAELAKMRTQALMALPGIGQANASRIRAAFELGIRLIQKHSSMSRLTTPQEVLFVVGKLAHYKQEHLVALYLSSRFQLLEKATIAVGSVNVTQVHPREIFVLALQRPVTQLILAHNHPSGDSNPSQEDIDFTKRVKKGGEILGIKLVDHLILTRKSYFSFKEAKIIE
jgi:DNA repair protein RadC